MIFKKVYSKIANERQIKILGFAERKQVFVGLVQSYF